MSELSANQHVVATYNVLSSSLCEPDYYSHCDPANLLPANRLEKLKALLSNEMDQGTILCLQEVSELWAAQLHALFQANGYHFVHRLYGSPFNGYMGVGIAFPNARYELEDADIVRVSDTRKWPRAPLPSDAPWAVASRAVVGALKGTTRLLLRKKPAKPPIVPVEYAKRRFNALVSVRLAMRDGNGSAPNLVVATYHMPCAFFAPPVMNMHVALCARRAIEFAKDDALVLCGDFNIKPHEPGYRILTQGCMSDDENAEHAAACEKSGIADDWAPALDKSLGGAFRSAYVEQLGLEPDFTNYAMNFKDTGPFIDTLDYILVRDGMPLKSTESGGMVATGVKTRMEVTDVRALPHRKEVTDGPYPNDTELSDHAMLKANLTIT